MGPQLDRMAPKPSPLGIWMEDGETPQGRQGAAAGRRVVARGCLRGCKAKTCASQRWAGKISLQHQEDRADLGREGRMTRAPGVRGLWGSAGPGPSPHQHTCASSLGLLPISLHSSHSTFTLSGFLCPVTQKPLTRTSIHPSTCRPQTKIQVCLLNSFVLSEHSR